MISFSLSDFSVIIGFFIIVILIGFISGRKLGVKADDYLLSGRKVGLFLFILTNVSTWYGGILGVGEFTYRYGLLSWFTQGLPYYIFAFLFAILFARKVREASLFTIPDKIKQMYGRKAGLLSAFIVFILVSPAPYLLMTANLISLLFGTGILLSLVMAFFLSVCYLFQGGFRSNVYADAFQFFVMFIGFILILVIAYFDFGGMAYLKTNLPVSYLKPGGDASLTFIIVWFLIALWTFADPGFHQRCYAAKSGSIAVKGIIISIFFWFLFDFLTTSTGLYARAAIPNLAQPVNSYPLLAEKILSPGFKGVFYAAMFATIMSTLNSFLFLSGTTIGRDFIFQFSSKKDESKLKYYTIIGLVVSGIVAIAIAYFIPSVIEIWYTVGSLCIPGIILPIISAYYPKLKVPNKIIIFEMVTALLCSTVWYFIRNEIHSSFFIEVEPMLVGLTAASFVHLFGIFSRMNLYADNR
jgi:solute:Na+ symporter, SSS family